MGNKCVYSFIEVTVYPPQDCKFFQLFKSGLPQPFIYSELHLKRCFDILNSLNHD